jgi:hypothetical protein
MSHSGRLAICLAMLGAVLIGCASDPGVAPVGPDTYLITRQAATGFSGLGSLKVRALREAGSYCAQRGREMQVRSVQDTKPPYIFTNYPRTEIEFSCIERGGE